MPRALLSTVLAVAGLLAVTGNAGANIGDIDRLAVDDQAFGTANTVELSGSIRCQASLDYGLFVWVGQNAEGDGSFTGLRTDADTGLPLATEAETQGTGAFGPGFAPETGISDDNPCSQSQRAWDVVVQRNQGSGEFQGTEADPGGLAIFVAAGSSAQDGDRGPGPFVGDFVTTGLEASFVR